MWTTIFVSKSVRLSFSKDYWLNINFVDVCSLYVWAEQAASYMRVLMGIIWDTPLDSSRKAATKQELPA